MKISTDAQDREPSSLANQATHYFLIHISGASLHRTIIKLSVVAGLVLMTVLLIHASPLNDVLHDVQRLKGWLDEAGGYGPVLFVVPAALLVAGGFPRMLMASLAGTLLGFREGFLFSWAASLAGAYMNFLLFRWAACTLAQRVVKKAPRLNALISSPSVLSIVLVRQLPLWGLVQNAALAITDVRHLVFLTGTLLGILPTTLIITLISSGIGKSDLAEALQNLGWAMMLLLILVAGSRQLNKRRRAVKDADR